MQTIWYRVIDHCEERYYDIELPDTYNLARPMEQTLIAAQCAEDYHSNHDGWESNWPLTFALHGTEEGQEVARLNIDREAVPHFYASHVKPPNVGGEARLAAHQPSQTTTATPQGVASTD